MLRQSSINPLEPGEFSKFTINPKIQVKKIAPFNFGPPQMIERIIGPL